MALGRLHPSDEYDIRIAVEEGEGGSLDGKWIAMLVDEIEHYSGENTRLTALLAERDAEIARLVAERDALRARAERAELANTAGRRYLDAADKMYALRAWDGNGKVMRLWGEWRAALAAASEGEGQG